MQRETLIIGSGISAGFAYRIVSKLSPTRISLRPATEFSPIPQIVPRRLLFDSLGISSTEENEAVRLCAPSIKDVLVQAESGQHSFPLKSDDRFFVFEKRKFVSWLLRLAKLAPPVATIESNIAEALDNNKGCTVLDCRGAAAVADDPNYQHELLRPARTATSYAIIQLPPRLSRDSMRFWTCFEQGERVVAFCAPIDDRFASFGCSHDPSRKMTIGELQTLSRRLDLEISFPSHLVSMTASCPIVKSSSSRADVIAFGEARCATCPLTEYGVLAALSQILEFVGLSPFSNDQVSRLSHDPIDPHYMSELAQ